MDPTVRTWAEIDLGNIRHNVKEIKSVLPEGCKFLAVVKANAQGHGAARVAEAALEAGADYFSVSSLSEAEELRSGGFSAPILSFGVTPPQLAGAIADLDVTQLVPSLDYARALAQNLGGRSIKAHMKLDTGMSRMGFRTESAQEMAEAAEALKIPQLRFEGIFTHFASSEYPENGATERQYARFAAAVSALEAARGQRFEIRHCANSGAVINYRQYALDMVRPGILLYGMYPTEATGGLNLRPALSLKTRIYDITHHDAGDEVGYGGSCVLTRPSRLAVVPIGYADGLKRCLSGGIDMLVHGKRVRQIGKICMDMCMLDVTDVDCRCGDVVTVIGSDGGETITASELAEKAGTINYEITATLSPRVERVYIG